MRLKLLSFAILTALTLAACKPVPKDQARTAFVKELHLYFNNLNNEAQARKDEMRKSDARLGLTKPTGLIYSTYAFDENAFVVFNYKCKTCETKLIVSSPETQYLCPSCGHCPFVQHPAGFNPKESPCKLCLGADGKPKEPSPALISKESFERAEGASVRPMFELTQSETSKPLEATVRYVRRQWAYDPRGTVVLSQRVLERAAVDPSVIPTDGPSGRNPGYHRLDAIYVGQMDVVYRSGEISIRSRKADEAVRPWNNLKGDR